MRTFAIACTAIATLMLASCAADKERSSALSATSQACGTTDSSAQGETTAPGWQRSYRTGCRDGNGRFSGGSQVIHLVPHKGRLYAANGYWMDQRNIWYGGHDPNTGWGQVLSLSGPNEPWTVDLELGPRHLRTELLKSVTFSIDQKGHPLAAPDTLLIAATYDGPGGNGISVFVRNDETGSWIKSSLIVGDTGKRGEDNSVRAAAVYRDRVTGRERLFISVGILGLYSGQYDLSRPGKINWASAPEFGPTRTRILAIVEANDSLYVSEGAKIYRRIDGSAPRYEAVADMSDDADANTDRATFQTIGGIRGLTAIAGPVLGKQSLIFLWNSGKNSQACVFRLDPKPDGSYARVRETCLADLISRHLDNTPIPYALGAYSNFLPMRDPQSKEIFYLVGLEAFIPASSEGRRSLYLTARNQRNDRGGFYAGAMYALRDVQGRWRVSEVNGKYEPGKPELVSVYTYALSPFGDEDSQAIYFGGYDANYFSSSDTAWVFRTSVANALREAPARK